MVDTVYEPKVDMHKVKRYRVDNWFMITFWDYKQFFHVVLQSEWDHDNVHLMVAARAGRKNKFKLLAIKSALHTVIDMEEMSEETADKFIAATGYQQ